MSRILIVEDDAASRRLVRDILRHRHHEVIEAASIDEGRALLHQVAPELVLLDIHIAGHRAEALLTEIRNDPGLVTLPVVAITAQAMRGDRERLLAAGFNGYVSKPINTRAFGLEVESFINEQVNP
jgi:CheY-like chemotaxis protein